MKPFFKFYGGKWRAAPLYPAPMSGLPIIEPFAGSAGYSVRLQWPVVKLYDVDPIIVAVWSYLIRVGEGEILGLPDLEVGEDVNGFTHLPQEARWLIGFWLNSGSAQPKRRMSTGANIPRARSSYWGGHARRRIAEQLRFIRTWSAEQRSFDEIPNAPATWFVDPPYQGPPGRHYRFDVVDYDALALWCRSRSGRVIACENVGATWLPFQPLAPTQAFQKRSAEAIWVNA